MLVITSWERAAKGLANTPDSPQKIEAYATLASLYYQLGRLERSILFYEKAIDLMERYDQKIGYCATIANYGSILRELRGSSVAIPFYEKAIDCSLLAEDTLLTNRVKKNLSELKYEVGAYQQAYDLLRNYMVFQDSMLEKNYKDQLAKLSMEYETEKQSSQIKSLKLQNFRRTRERNYLVYNYRPPNQKWWNLKRWLPWDS